MYRNNSSINVEYLGELKQHVMFHVFEEATVRRFSEDENLNLGIIRLKLSVLERKLRAGVFYLEDLVPLNNYHED